MKQYFSKNTSRRIQKREIWSQKHEEFCLENKIPPAAKLLWQWLIKEDVGSESEPDLADFNKWVKRHRGKAYCRLTLKHALTKLIDCEVVNLVKQYTWRVVKIVTRFLDWLQPKKNLQNDNEIYDLPAPNPQSAENQVNSSSISSSLSSSKEEILTICSEAGINYSSNKPSKVFDYSVEDIRYAIEHFKVRSLTTPINNPEGWLIACLEYRYWETQVTGLSFSFGSLL